ncbi:alpha/beta fold hydrolase [Amnibacterium sp. CER49]|uniref:alpha/beta fold hydrolase n=1 Tax=Amnibacterium sp. CER49 TaxID=3039161 RepID=UPI00244852F2|nr:alpha/beta fold hydrolase [Amnibacterium sp. CER49]MDH2443719.1 alpha/beta fold hydrolase [Amnibacterium sp. CER49]
MTGTDTAAAELRPPGTGYVEVDGRLVRIRRAGTGEPLLLLHGIGRSLEDWSEQFDRLGDRFALIALDLPGFAHSDRLPQAATLEAYAAFLPRLLDALGVHGPVHVAGNSLGGAVAMTLAASRPDSVRSLVLASSAGFGREVTLALRLLAIPPIGRRLLVPSRDASARAERSIFVDRTLATDDRVAWGLALASRPDHATTLLEVARSLGTFRGVRPRWRRRLLERLATLQIPTLVLWGEGDRVLPAAHLPAAAVALPSAETHLFAGTGHMPQIERPDAFADLVSAFLERHPIGGDR